MGLLPIMVARKSLTTDETYDLKTRIDEAMSLMKHQDEKIIQSLLGLMYDLQPLGLLGV